MKCHLNKHLNEEITFGLQYHKYFYLHYDNETGKFVYAEEKISVTEREISLCGYFVLVFSERMTAKDAIYFYKGRDISEKTFAADKTFWEVIVCVCILRNLHQRSFLWNLLH